MTFCPWPVYKKRGYYFQKDDFNDNTFDLEDIFHPVMLQFLKMESLYQIKTTWSVFYGKCFTLKYKVKHKPNFFHMGIR